MNAGLVNLATASLFALAVLAGMALRPGPGFQAGPPVEVAAGPDAGNEAAIAPAVPSQEMTNPETPEMPAETKAPPGMSDGSLITGRVHAVNASHHKVTLELRDGSIKTFKTTGVVNLAGVFPGVRLTLELKEDLAVSVRKLPTAPASF